MNTNPFNRGMNSRRGLFATARPFFCIALFCFLGAGDLVAQCLTGEPVYQLAPTNRMRCGRAGYVTNDTYYFVEDVNAWTWKYPTNFPTCTRYYYERTTQTGSVSNDCIFNPYPCNYSSSNYSTVNVPTVCSCTCTNRVCPGCADCFTTFAWIFVDLDAEEHLACVNEHTELLTDAYKSNWIGRVYCDAIGSMTNIEEYSLSVPYTLSAFAAATLAAARNHWEDGGGFAYLL